MSTSTGTPAPACNVCETWQCNVAVLRVLGQFTSCTRHVGAAVCPSWLCVQLRSLHCRSEIFSTRASSGRFSSRNSVYVQHFCQSLASSMSSLKQSYGNGFWEVGPQFGFLPKSAPLSRYPSKVALCVSFFSFLLIDFAQTASKILRIASAHGRPSRLEESRFRRTWSFSS